MNCLLQVIAEKKMAYVTRDIERAIGLSTPIEGYIIITNNSPFAQAYAKQHTGVYIIPSERILDTHELLSHEQTKQILETNAITRVLVFKPTAIIEDICTTNGWQLLNPPAALAKTVEEKISQVAWLGDLASLLPPHTIDTVQHIAWNGEPFIVQFNRAHTGSGTLFIQSEEDLRPIQQRFPQRPARVSAYINGYTITNNTIVSDTNILIGNISYQITGLAPFTTEPFSTIGNDFSLPHRLLTYTQQSTFKEMANAIGKRLQSQGWRGAFGIDVLVEKETGMLYLLEINARQPASVSFESYLQEYHRPKNSDALTTFEAHLAAVLGADLSQQQLVPLTDGAQIIIRQQGQSTTTIEAVANTLSAASFRVIPYNNSDANSDLLRIQSTTGIMQNHAQFNEHGQRIVHTITAQSLI